MLQPGTRVRNQNPTDPQEGTVLSVPSGVAADAMVRVAWDRYGNDAEGSVLELESDVTEII